MFKKIVKYFIRYKKPIKSVRHYYDYCGNKVSEDNLDHCPICDGIAVYYKKKSHYDICKNCGRRIIPSRINDFENQRFFIERDENMLRAVMKYYESKNLHKSNRDLSEDGFVTSYKPLV